MKYEVEEEKKKEENKESSAYKQYRLWINTHIGTTMPECRERERSSGRERERER